MQWFENSIDCKWGKRKEKETEHICYNKDVELDRIKSPNSSIFIVTIFYYAINYLNINRVTIYRTKCIDIVIYRQVASVTTQSKKAQNFPNPKMKLNKTDTSFLM